MTDDLKIRFEKYLEDCDKAYLEYEETHGDAGAGYAHVLVESWRNGYAKRPFIDYAKEHTDCSEQELRELVKRFGNDAEWSIEFKPGHIFSCQVPPEEGIVIDSWDLGEVENQYEVSVIAEHLDCEEEEVRALVRQARQEHNFCIGSIYREDFQTFETYQTTDAVWLAVVPRSWFDDTLSEIREENADA